MVMVVLPGLRCSIVELLPPVAVLLVLGAEPLRRRVAADLGDRHVPPDAAAGQVAVLLGLDHNGAGPLLRARLAQGLAELLLAEHVPAPGAEALGLLGQVDGAVLA